MAKRLHEIRDPIHVFIRLDSDERQAVDSEPFQRLRHIHQLALSYLVYPGATHRRFEHSLGVMDLASRVFDVVTTNPTPQSSSIIPDEQARLYWRRVLRMAALCHDLGHLPFSHAGEDLLPKGWTHERISVELILSDEMKGIWQGMTPPLRAQDIVKLAVGQKGAPDISFNDWELLLAEIITGDAFGVDRMDYLLRDSHHAGVAYGRFDHYRLIDTLRILPRSEGDTRSAEGEIQRPLTLGIEEGGLRSAEALLLARYYMFTQLYFHPVRRIYDIHLKDFLIAWRGPIPYSTDVNDHLALTDNEVLAAIRAANRNPEDPAHEPASRILRRKHFRLLYERTPSDRKVNFEAERAIYKAAEERYGTANVRFDQYAQRSTPLNFPVLMKDDSIQSSLDLSTTLNAVPTAAVDYVFIAPEHLSDAQAWLRQHKADVIAPKEETE